MDRMLDRRLGMRFQQVFGGRYVDKGTGYTQTALETISWSFPENHGGRPTRLGIIGDDSFTRSGVTVTHVEKDSPASQSLQLRDILVSINGEKVKDVTSFTDLVRSSSKKMRLVYRRGDEEHSAETTLRW